LQEEPGIERVKSLLREASKGKAEVFLSLINLGEVAYIIERRYGQIRKNEFLMTLSLTSIKVAEVTYSRVLEAAHIKAGHSISFADAFAVSLANELGATILTGDPEFKEVEGIAKIEWMET
jgi:ribonuclease VapC